MRIFYIAGAAVAVIVVIAVVSVCVAAIRKKRNVRTCSELNVDACHGNGDSSHAEPPIDILCEAPS